MTIVTKLKRRYGERRRAANANELIRRNTPLHDDRLPFILVFTPKAGCTSLLKWFLFQTGELAQARAHATWLHRYRIGVLQARAGYREALAQKIVRGDTPVIKLVRNPYHRAVSSFLQQANLMMNKPSAHVGVRVFAHQF